MRKGSGKSGGIKVTLPLIIVLACVAGIGVFLWQKAKKDRATAEAKSSALELERVAARPFTARNGLANVARKLAAGGPITMVFLGGSITENPNGFSRQLPERLQEKFPQLAMHTVNAGWAGTNSTLGAARVEREILAHAPDLVFVEFAVNDADDPQTEPMERIVRKIWTASPETDIAFLYSLAKPDLDFYGKGKLPPAVICHERVASHYGIPGIAMGFDAAQRLLSGALEWYQFSRDTVHPTPLGHALYTEAVGSALDVCLAVTGPQKHVLPEPLTPFALNPPVISVEPLPPTALKELGGKTVSHVWELPLPGRHWVGDSEWKIGSEPIWQLYSQPMISPETLDASVGLDRTNWSRADWLEEAGFFLGQSNRWIAGGRGEKASDFGASSKELAVVTFLAPTSGNYVVEFGAESLGGFSSEKKSMALNVVRFPRGAMAGESVAFHTSSKVEMKPFDTTAEVQLNAGDELAFVFLVKNIGGGAFYHGFRAAVGSR